MNSYPKALTTVPNFKLVLERQRQKQSHLFRKVKYRPYILRLIFAKMSHIIDMRSHPQV